MFLLKKIGNQTHNIIVFIQPFGIMYSYKFVHRGYQISRLKFNLMFNFTQWTCIYLDTKCCNNKNLYFIYLSLTSCKWILCHSNALDKSYVKIWKLVTKRLQYRTSLSIIWQHNILKYNFVCVQSIYHSLVIRK